jgi:putative inorganic carbon (hco3(-)) transporter
VLLGYVILKSPDKVTRYSFYLLFFLTPLIFTPFNNELFEYNKMILVYILTSVITFTWIIKMLQTKEILIRRTPLDIPLMLFLLSQILSTIFSMDAHTSIWGYYSRSNGGLLSIISYILLFYAFISNYKGEEVLRFLKVALLGGLVVSLYGIPEHFGVSPSCMILTSSISADCWVQDVQARVFATLGQPNWLGAYLAMLIFPAIYFFLQAAHKKALIITFATLIALYMAFTFTFSRGATLGLLGGFGVFVFLFAARKLYFKQKDENKEKLSASKLLLIALSGLIIINLLFGSALTRFKLISESKPPEDPNKPTASGVTQLESGGTESGQIRLIVWQGAMDIFRRYPVFGSGVETFAYSYYNFRPTSHNLVSEWDFLYNKAHNEYLNYLATTGLFGFLSYMAVILGFIFWSLRQLLFKEKAEHLQSSSYLLISSLLAGYVSYLIQNIFGFSVVVIAMFFFLFPALAFSYSGATYPLHLSKGLLDFFQKILKVIYKREVYKNLTYAFLLLFLVLTLSTILRFWVGDYFFKQGSNYSDSGNPGRAYNYLIWAVRFNGGEPLYRSELGYAASSAAVALSEEDATLSANLKDEAIEETNKALSISPKNLSLIRTAIRTHYQLSAIDPKFEGETIKTIDKAIELAPTDAKLYYNKGLILFSAGQDDEAIKVLNQAKELKPNYTEVYFTLGTIYDQKQDFKMALQGFEAVLKLDPTNTDAKAKVEELKTKI